MSSMYRAFWLQVCPAAAGRSALFLQHSVRWSAGVSAAVRPRAPRTTDAMALALTPRTACAIMRADPAFAALFQVVSEEVKRDMERQALSHHTTTSCRLKHLRHEAPAVSLHEAGMDTPIADAGVGVSAVPGVRVRLDMPNLLRAGDGRPVAYVTDACVDHVEAKRQAALEYMCLMLGVEPQQVRLPPKCFKRGGASVERVREAARAACLARRVGDFDAWAWTAGPLTAQPVFGAPPPPPRGPRPSLYTAPKDESAREALVLRELLSWREPWGGFQASRLPPWQRQFLEANVPKGGMCAFLERHPDEFGFHRERGLWWKRVAGVSAATSSGIPREAADQPGQAAGVSAAAAEGALAAACRGQGAHAAAAASEGHAAGVSAAASAGEPTRALAAGSEGMPAAACQGPWAHVPAAASEGQAASVSAAAGAGEAAGGPAAATQGVGWSTSHAEWLWHAGGWSWDDPSWSAGSDWNTQRCFG